MSHLSLQRNLKDGKKYNALIPKSACEKVYFGKGDTFYSVEKIKSQAIQHTNQVQKLAKVLKNEVATNSLQSICLKIHWFLYNHIQYKADGEAQLLRSPACAWQSRYDGVDCKSYSVFASAILLQLGIKHYIRQIKQLNKTPDKFTHVYVVVPVNQNSGNLKDGYYTIDGTLQHTNEPYYLQEESTFMDLLPHYGLNGVGLSAEENNTILGIDFSSWNLGSLSCIGGAFDANTFNLHLTEVTNFYNNEIAKLNNATANGDLPAVQKAVNRIMQQALMNAHYSNLANGYWWSSPCTIESVKAFNQASNYFLTLFKKTLINGWLSEYFNFNSYQRPSSTLEFYTKNYYPNDQFVIAIPTTQYKDFSLKEGITAIKKYEFTPYVNNTVFTSAFNPVKYIDSLPKTLVTFTGNSNDVYDSENPNNSNQYSQDPTSKAGIGKVLGWGLTAGALVYLFSKLKPKKK